MSVHTSPFIPPLPDDAPTTPGRRHVIPGPSPRQSSGPLPAWGATPAVHPAQMPGSYFTAPVGLPPQGTAEDWIGWGHVQGGPPAAPPGSAWSQPAALHPSMVHGPPPSAWSQAGSLHPHGPPPPSTWSQPSAIHPGTPWHGPPQMGYVAVPMGYGPAQTPMVPPGYTLGLAMPPAGYPGTPWAGGAMPMTPASTMPYAERNLSQVRDSDKNLNTQFLKGKHYGPVLDQIHVAAVGVYPAINPLLLPAPDNPEDRDYIVWNMLFDTGFARRSSDPTHRSWSKGRDDPATFPRVSSLRLLSRAFSWVIDIKATDPSVGVTCGEVVDRLNDFLHARGSRAEYNGAPPALKEKVRDSYYYNRSRVHGVPGGRLGEGMLRVDWLGVDTMFDGVERDPEYVRAALAISSRKELPCVYVLRCGKRDVVTEEELRDLEREEHRRRRSRSRARSNASSGSSST